MKKIIYNIFSKIFCEISTIQLEYLKFQSLEISLLNQINHYEIETSFLFKELSKLNLKIKNNDELIDGSNLDFINENELLKKDRITITKNYEMLFFKLNMYKEKYNKIISDKLKFEKNNPKFFNNK